MNPLLASLLLTVILWLTGCAGSSVNAKLTSEPDFKSGPEFMPKAEASFGYTF